MTYKRQLKEWAESGSLRPNLRFDAESEHSLREMQHSLYQHFADSSPDIRTVDSLHATAFYIKPSRLFTYMQERVNPHLRPEDFYPHLMTAASMLLLFSEPQIIHTGIIERFGPNDETIAVTLDQTEFVDASMNVKEDVKLTLQRFGLTKQAENEMAQDTHFTWLVSDSIPHVSLLENVPISPLPIPQESPQSIPLQTSGVDVGSVSAGPESAQELFWWHLRGLPGDTMQNKNFKH